MNLKKVFEKLAANNINQAECRYASSTSLSMEVFRGEMNNFTTHTNSVLNLDVIVDNKLIMVNTENLSKKGVDQLINSIKETTPYVEKIGGEIFRGADKYKKYNHFNKELSLVPIEKKKQLIFDLENKLKNYDKRFSEISVSYEEASSVHEYQNTYGVKLKRKSNSYC